MTQHASHIAARATSFPVLTLALLVSGPAAAQGNFGLVPALDAPDCRDWQSGGLSADGQTLLVTQQCSLVDPPVFGLRGQLHQAFREGSTPVTLTSSPDHGWNALSDAGDVAVGARNEDYGATGYVPMQAVAWRASEGIIDLGGLPGADPSIAPSIAYGIAPDGGTIVGGADNGCGIEVPFVWTAATGMQTISAGSLPVPEFDENDVPACVRPGRAYDVSRDGAVVVGASDQEAFVWDAEQGMRLLGDGPGSSRRTYEATHVSEDGAVVAGHGLIDGIPQPFVWTEATGVQPLASPGGPDLSGTWPKGMSADGRVIVGGRPGAIPDSGIGGTNHEGFVWIAEAGARNARRLLDDLGVETHEWSRFTSVWAVSADGSTIAGSGLRGNSNDIETFYASLRRPQTGARRCALEAPDCIPVEIVARTGLLATPDWENGSLAEAIYVEFDDATLNDARDVAYSATARWLADESGAASPLQIFGRDRSGRSNRCAGNGFPSTPVTNVGSADARLSEVFRDSMALEASGHVLFWGTMHDAANGFTSGIFRCHPDEAGVSAVARPGGPLSSPADGSISSIDTDFQLFRSSFETDGRGGVSFVGATSDPLLGSAFSVVVPDGEGGHRVVVRDGETLPGLPPDRTFHHTRAPAASPSGAFVFAGRLAGPAGPLTEESGLWVGDAEGGVELVLRHGDPAPGFPSDTTFGPPRSLYGAELTPALRASGEIAFSIPLDLPGGPSAPSYSTVWRWTKAGGLALVADEEDALPGLDGSLGTPSFVSPRLTDHGDLLLPALFPHGPSNDDRGAQWLLRSDGQTISILRSGQQAPGLPDGVRLDAWTRPEAETRLDAAYLAVNESGHVLVEYGLEGTGVDASNDRALWLVDRKGEATLVVRRGDGLEVADGDVRTIGDYRVSFGSRNARGRSPLNAWGDVVARLDFTDGSSAVVRFAVPEPELAFAFAAGVVGLVGLDGTRRSRRSRERRAAEGSAFSRA
ncbi:MAG: hypothetical protein R3F35_16645 [Myxococcota bacterium]